MSGKCAACEMRGKPFKMWTMKQKGAVAGIAAVFLLLFVMGDDNGPLAKWAKSVDRENRIEQIGAQMRDLADQGKPEAIIWMALNYPDAPERLKALEALAESGHSVAMMHLAAFKRSTDLVQARALVAKAAAAGNPDAVMAVVRHPERYKL